MDMDFADVPAGVDYSQLSATEKKLLLDCLVRLIPFGWTHDTVRIWYQNRKISVLRVDGASKFYGLLPSNQWRLLLTFRGDGQLDWAVGTIQWQPVERKA